MNIKHYRVLITKAPAAPETDAQELAAMLDKLGLPFFSTTIPRLKAFSKAAAEGLIVSETRAYQASRAWEAYKAMGKEVLHHASS